MTKHARKSSIKQKIAAAPTRRNGVGHEPRLSAQMPNRNGGEEMLAMVSPVDNVAAEISRVRTPLSSSVPHMHQMRPDEDQGSVDRRNAEEEADAF